MGRWVAWWMRGVYGVVGDQVGDQVGLDVWGWGWVLAARRSTAQRRNTSCRRSSVSTLLLTFLGSLRALPRSNFLMRRDTFAPTTLAPTTMAPTTYSPTTLAPTTYAPTTVGPTPPTPLGQTNAPTPPTSAATLESLAFYLFLKQA